MRTHGRLDHPTAPRITQRAGERSDFIERCGATRYGFARVTDMGDGLRRCEAECTGCHRFVDEVAHSGDFSRTCFAFGCLIAHHIRAQCRVADHGSNIYSDAARFDRIEIFRKSFERPGRTEP